MFVGGKSGLWGATLLPEFSRGRKSGQGGFCCPVHTHPGRAPGSRPGCPGAGMCHCKCGQLRPVGRGRTQSGRPGLGRSCGNRAPTGPRSKPPAAPGKAANHSAASGCQGPRRGCPCGWGLSPCRPGYEPGFHFHRRQDIQTRGTRASRPRVLWEGTGEVREAGRRRGPEGRLGPS